MWVFPALPAVHGLGTLPTEGTVGAGVAGWFGQNASHQLLPQLPQPQSLPHLGVPPHRLVALDGILPQLQPLVHLQRTRTAAHPGHLAGQLSLDKGTGRTGGGDNNSLSGAVHLEQLLQLHTSELHPARHTGAVVMGIQLPILLNRTQLNPGTSYTTQII